MQNLKINWVKDANDYCEKGLDDGLELFDGQYIKWIVGYDEDDEMDLIGYISCDGDIKQFSDDDLWDAFYAYFD